MCLIYMRYISSECEFARFSRIILNFNLELE